MISNAAVAPPAARATPLDPRTQRRLHTHSTHTGIATIAARRWTPAAFSPGLRRVQCIRTPRCSTVQSVVGASSSTGAGAQSSGPVVDEIEIDTSQRPRDSTVGAAGDASAASAAADPTVAVNGFSAAEPVVNSEQPAPARRAAGGRDPASTADVGADAATVDTDTAKPAAGEQPSTADTNAAKPAAGGQPEQPAWKPPKLLMRTVFGIALALLGGFIVLTGRKLYCCWVCLLVYQATREYYGFITSKGISKGMTPPPPLVSTATTVLCVSISVVTFLCNGHSGTALAVAAFMLLALECLAVKRPRFAQLATSVFGLFYCGYLPSFWLKLRMIAEPGPDTSLVVSLLPWSLSTPSVGLLATLVAVVCCIASDTGAFFVGKLLGRTKLTEISPKKTVEGAVGGLCSSVAAALAAYHLLAWPADPLIAAGLGVLVFFSSLFGDLIESVMKREAGLKDSGDLIPGHGGLLDRFDSYIFTGAVTYFYTRLAMSNFGVA